MLLFFSQSSRASLVFVQNCRAIGDDYLQFSIESDLISDSINATISDPIDFSKSSSLAFKVTAFEDEKCKTAYLKFNQYFTIASIQGESINLKTEKVTYLALTKEVAEALNSIQYCNVQNWQVAAEINVTGQICDDYQQLAKGDFFYQIIKNQNDLLKFGALSKNLDGRSLQRRPVQFDILNYIKTK